jgi:hypothetical protein
MNEVTVLFWWSMLWRRGVAAWHVFVTMLHTSILGDPRAPEGERAQRKRRLLKGPSEFIDARVDRPKAKK